MSRSTHVLATVVAVVSIAAGSARAGGDYFDTGSKATQVTIVHGKDRSTGALALIGGLVAGAALAGGVGAYYNLDSRDAANAVSAKTLTGKTWTGDLQATYDRAHASGVRAEIGYGVAGAFVVAAVIAFWQTEPGETTVDLAPSSPTPTLTPAPGGAILGATWGF